MKQKVLSWDSITGEIDSYEITTDSDATLEQVCGAIDKVTSMDQTMARCIDVQCMVLGNCLIIGRRWEAEAMVTVDIVQKVRF